MSNQSLSRAPRRALPPPGTRHVGAHHFAFLRAWVQGLPLGEIADRYLESGLDARLARSQLIWLRAELVALASRSPRPELAPLLRRSPHSPVASTASAALPSLDEFATRFPDGFYSENELAKLFATEFATALTPAERRRSRLVERQLAALQYLEPLTAVPPQPGDGVNAWFLEAVASRLANAGFTTLAHVQAVYRTRGPRWWTQVPRLGRTGAARIVKWWTQHEASLGPLYQFRRDARSQAPSSSNVALPLSAATTSTCVVDLTHPLLSPLETMVLPPHFSGENGSNRQTRDRCKLTASNDLEAIKAWLSTRPENSATWRSYRKEAERFLLWAVVERGRPFSGTTTEDCVAYRDFLSDPQPAFRWVSSGTYPRWSHQWRPFGGPLSAASAQHTQTVLRLLYEWLVRQRYLDSNPWDGVPIIAPNRIRLKVGHAFTQDQWALVVRFLGNLPPSPAAARLQFVVPFFYATGLRLSEMAAARMRQLEYSAEAGGWLLHILGKGLIPREVPLATDTTALLVKYLEQAYPAARMEIEPSLDGWVERLDPDLPLLRGLDLNRGALETLSASAIYKSLKGFFSDVAHRAALLSDKERKRFAEASTHWLRHTFATHAVADNAPLDVIRDVMGHASISTTSIYVSAEKKRRVAQMEKLADLRRQRLDHLAPVAH